MTDLGRRSVFPASLAVAAVLMAGGCVEPTSETATSKAPRAGTAPPPESSSSSPKTSAGSTSSGKTTPVSLPPPSPTKKPNPKDYGKIKENSLDGAEWAATYYLDAIGYGYATWNVDILKELADAECDACKTFVDSIEQLKKDKEYGVDAVFDYQSYSSRLLSKNHYSVTIKIHEPDFRVVHLKDKTTKKQLGKDYSIKVVVRRQDNFWTMLEMGKAKE